jgi:anti-anti-sigma factor
MKITVVSHDPPLRLRLDGQLTMMETAEADRQLEEALVSAGYRQKVLLDLESTTFIDSSGISWLMITHKHFVQGGGKIVFHSAPPLIEQTLKLLRLNLVLNMADDEDVARTMALEGKK